MQFVVAASIRLSVFNKKIRMFQRAVKQRIAASSQAMAVYVQTRAESHSLSRLSPNSLVPLHYKFSQRLLRQRKLSPWV